MLCDRPTVECHRCGALFPASTKDEAEEQATDHNVEQHAEAIAREYARDGLEYHEPIPHEGGRLFAVVRGP